MIKIELKGHGSGTLVHSLGSMNLSPMILGHCGNYIYGYKSDICPLDWERDKDFEGADIIILLMT